MLELSIACTAAAVAWLYLIDGHGGDWRTSQRLRLVIGLAALLTGATGSATLLTAAAGLAGWALMSLSYLPMLRLYRLSPLRAPGLPLVALLYAGMTADSARRHYAGRGAQWRGRTTPTR